MKITKILFVLILGLALSLTACDAATSASTTSADTTQTTTTTTAQTTTTSSASDTSTTVTTTSSSTGTTTGTTTTPTTTTSAGAVTTTTTERVFTLTELSTYNGNNGSLAYMAVNGIVYDVTHADGFNNGWHQGYHLAGTDATVLFAASPHPDSILSTLPIVGSIQN